MYRLYALDRRTMNRVYEGSPQPARKLGHLFLQARRQNENPFAGNLVYEVERVML